jgi:hypothetical protein
MWPLWSALKNADTRAHKFYTLWLASWKQGRSVWRDRKRKGDAGTWPDAGHYADQHVPLVSLGLRLLVGMTRCWVLAWPACQVIFVQRKNAVRWRDQMLKLRSDRTRKGKAVPLTQVDVACVKRKPALTGRTLALGRVRPGASGRVFVALDPLCTWSDTACTWVRSFWGSHLVNDWWLRWPFSIVVI